MIRIKRGLDLPISGQPNQQIDNVKPLRSVAVMGGDYVGVRPTMAVQPGSQVKTGDVLFTCKKTPGLRITSPAAGVVSAVNRGKSRALVSVVIDVEEQQDDAVTFAQHARADLLTLSAGQVREQLLVSGLWAALRTRPFNKVPSGEATAPTAIFINAMDTRPLAADPGVVLAGYRDDFYSGIEVISRLTSGEVFVCTDAQLQLDFNDQIPNVYHETFSGPHPAGLAGTHIHYLKPVSIGTSVWTIGYQDVIAVGRLFLTGRLWNERIISLAGPAVTRPRLLHTRLGANLEELAAGEIEDLLNVRLISGSVLDGQLARGITAFLGRYDLQLSVLEEGRSRKFLGYMSPGINRHSVLPVYWSRFFRKYLLDLTTTTNGSARGMVPVGAYESVMPLDILATQLLRALLTEDVDLSIQLGCLELAEEDLALCTYSCPSKYEYGPVLRRLLNRIEKEG